MIEQIVMNHFSQIRNEDNKYRQMVLILRSIGVHYRLTQKLYHMKHTQSLALKLGKAVALMVLLLTFHLKSIAQEGITVYQYRHVPNDKIDEFIKRETTYWSVVAQKALAKGNLTFWALLEKQGGYDLENSSNFLFVNTYKDIDKAGEVWNTSAAFPNVTLDKMETNSMSTTTSAFFLQDGAFEMAPNVNPDKDFQYISMLYHNTNYPDSLITLEKTYWEPFIKSAMEKKQTTQLGWGNARILSPSGDNIKTTTVSYDLYSSLKEALNPTWDPKTVFPNKGLGEINSLELNRRGSVVYRIVKAVSADQMK
jgi:hypothetical protein